MWLIFACLYLSGFIRFVRSFLCVRAKFNVFFKLSLKKSLAVTLLASILKYQRPLWYRAQGRPLRTVKFRVAAIRKPALAHRFKAAYVREDACRFLIGRTESMGALAGVGTHPCKLCPYRHLSVA